MKKYRSGDEAPRYLYTWIPSSYSEILD